MQLYTNKYNETFYVSDKQANTIAQLVTATKGGFASAIGYVSTSKRITPETADFVFISKFSIEKYYKRKIAKLKAVTFADVQPSIMVDMLMNAEPIEEVEALFELRKQFEITAMEKTLNGVRDSAGQLAHDRCYASIDDGVKVHFVTEKQGNIMMPVLFNGYPVCASVMLHALEVKRTVRVPGTYKPVNSGAPVRMSNYLNRAIKGSQNFNFMTFSLKDDNFEEIRIGGEVLTDAELLEVKDFV